jgi:hypothetical protein
LLVSTVSLVDHFTERARLHRNQGIFALVLLLAPLGMTARFVDRFEGHAVSGVVQSWHVVKDNKTNTITGYRATILADGTEWGSELLIFPPQANKPYVLRIGSFSSNDGPDFHATSGETIWSTVIFAMTVLAALVSRQNAVQSLPWYRAASTFVERSQGRLDAES